MSGYHKIVLDNLFERRIHLVRRLLLRKLSLFNPERSEVALFLELLCELFNRFSFSGLRSCLRLRQNERVVASSVVLFVFLLMHLRIVVALRSCS